MNRQPCAVITGGSRGIGRSLVEAFLREGREVVACGRSPEALEELARETQKLYPGRLATRETDVRDAAQVEALADFAVEKFQAVDCWVNNAGLGRFAPVDEITLEDWDEVLRTNLDGAFFGTRAAARVMKPRGGGWIFNIASLASKNPFAGGAAYNASKFGMLGLSEASMLDLRHAGIRVTAIMPGSVDTDFAHRENAGAADWMLAPEDVARLVLDFLRFPDRALPSRVEIRPTRPPKR